MNVNFTKINNEYNFYELFYKNKMWTRKVRFAQITKRHLRKIRFYWFVLFASIRDLGHKKRI